MLIPENCNPLNDRLVDSIVSFWRGIEYLVTTVVFIRSIYLFIFIGISNSTVINITVLFLCIVVVYYRRLYIEVSVTTLVGLDDYIVKFKKKLPMNIYLAQTDEGYYALFRDCDFIKEEDLNVTVYYILCTPIYNVIRYYS